MTQLELFFALSGLWMAAAWVPYILERFVSRGIMGTFANPSPDLPDQSPWAQRAKAAHRVGVESFVAFGPLAIFGIIKMPTDGLLGLMALIYFFAIVAHYVFYSIGVIVVRTVLFLVASGASIIMALRLLAWI